MRFVCDVMLGKLAKYLRILGFDAVYLRNVELLAAYDRRCRQQASQEPSPYFLTRRRKIYSYPITILIKSEHVREQIKELRELIRPFAKKEKFLTRCINCNVPLSKVQKEAVEHRIPEFVFHTYNLFMVCPQCGRIYWPGTHTQRMAELMEDLEIR